MSIMEIRDFISNQAKKYFSIGENATEDEFRNAYQELEKYHDYWQHLNQETYSCIIINTVFFIQKFEGNNKALEKLESLYPEYEKHFDYDYSNKSSIHEMWARLLITQDAEGAAYDHLKQAAYFNFIDNVSYDGFEYFSFRNFSEYSLADIECNTLTFSHPSFFNDPMDTILLRWNKYLLGKSTDDIDMKLRILYQKVYDHIKVRCFVRTSPLPRHQRFDEEPHIQKYQNIEDVSPLMWAHYANNHNGFCIKYKLPGNVVRNESQSSLSWTRIGNVNYKPQMIFDKNLTVFDALFAKYDIWSYENEVRLIHYDPNDNDNDNFKSISIPGDSIQEIYLGINCSDVNREHMKLILRNRNVKLYQMIVDSTDCYQLVKERIL